MTVANISVPLNQWPDGRFRTSEVPQSFVINGTGFGTGPTVILQADWSNKTIGATASLTDLLTGEFDSASYLTGLLPKFGSIGGKTGIGIREGGTDEATTNRITGFRKNLSNYTDRCVIYHLGVPAGRHFPGASSPETFPLTSVLKINWEFYGEPDLNTEADLVMLSWSGASWVVGGNQAVTEAGGTPNSLYCGSAFDFNAWNRHCSFQRAGTPDPFVNAGYTEVYVTTSSGTTRNLRTSMPTFNSANSAHAAYNVLCFPAWTTVEGDRSLDQMLFRDYYFADGISRVEMLNSSTYLASTEISPPLPFNSWSDTSIEVVPPEHWMPGMTHFCVTRNDGTQFITEIA